MTRRTALADLSAALESRRVTALELTEASLAAATDVSGPGPVSFIEIFADEARAAARAADTMRSAGKPVSPLTGIPIAIKALFDVKGHATTAGASVYGSAAHRDAAAVTILRDAGAVLLGHSNMTEFAFSGLGMNPHYGNPLSPWRRSEKRVAGGSTSGGAAAVADGIVPLALGSDTGGSCRIPAAFCNVTGFKPTQARVARGGMVPLSTTLDTVGWIANTVSCCIIAYRALTGDTGPVEPPSLKGLRFALPEIMVRGDFDPDVTRALDGAAATLRAAGALVETLAAPELDGIAHMNRLGGFSSYESYAWHRERIARHRDRYDPRVLARIERGREQTAADYEELKSQRMKLIATFAARRNSFDALLFPTTPILPPRIDDLVRDEDYHRVNLLALRNSAVINMLDGCAISMPVDPEGPPVGLTIAGLRGEDRHVLGVARSVEIALAAQRP